MRCIRLGCFANQRSIELDDDLRVNLRLPSNEQVYYTDLVAIPHQNKALLVRNDYVIFEVDAYGAQEITEIEEDDVFRRFDNLLNSKPSLKRSHPQAAVRAVAGRLPRGGHRLEPHLRPD